MFSNKNLKDRRIRFQHSSFTRKLQKARGYKRPNRKPGETPWENFMEGLGLNSRGKKISLLAVLILAIYLIYAPNFLTVKNIEISGLKQADAETVKSDIFSYLKKRSIFPQSNLLLLSAEKLSAFLSQNNEILNVSSIKKNYPKSLAIDLIPRLEQYLLQSGRGNFLISGDGLATAQIDEAVSPTSTSYGNLSLIKYHGNENIYAGQKILNPQLQNIARETKLKLAGIAKTPVAFFQFDDLNAEEISVFTQAGYRIIFDIKLDINESLQRLQLLLGQIAPSDQNKLLYVDMRFKNKGFACFKNTACAKQSFITAATSSPDTIKNNGRE